jgi:hypothetical protein
VAGLLFGCGPSPTEVIGPYDGSGGSSGKATESGVSSGELSNGTTGPIADGSAESGTGLPTTMTGDTGTTTPVDPMTTDPDTSISGDPPTTASSGDPGSSSSGDPPTPPSCMDIFGTADGYTLCSEDETSCTFALNSNGSTCNQVCNSFGQPCIGGINNPGGLECSSQGPLTCDQFENGTTICICAK